MYVKQVCTCGAVFEICDDRGTYINKGGKPVKGIKYVWEEAKRQWDHRHRECNPIAQKSLGKIREEE